MGIGIRKRWKISGSKVELKYIDIERDTRIWKEYRVH